MLNENNSNSGFSLKAFPIAILIIGIPALLINLGLFPLISDEPTRGIVTLEMLYSGDYIHPTINGELYFNKPPLFNWIQILFIKITGSTDEWVLRLPTVFSILGLSLLIYFTSRKYLHEYAFLAAMAFIVSGRVLFWDSFMGLIDITYSFVTFASFIWIIHFNDKKKYLLLFAGSYLLAALGYLMKGLPSIVFQGLSLLAVFIYSKNLKELFSIKHLTGVLLFIILIGGYYLIYNIDHPIAPVIERLISESNRLQDTQSDKSWWLHLIEFPLNFIYEFAPLSIALILLISKQIRQRVFNEPYYRYLLLLFLVNIVIYWVSANMRSRYLFMLIPLLFIILLKAYKEASIINHKLFNVVRIVFLIGSFLIALSIMIYPFWSETSKMQNVVIICGLLFISALSICIAALRNKQYVIYSLFGTLLLARIAFNMFNLPARINSYPDQEYKMNEITAARLSAGSPLYVLGNTPINHDALYYITKERKEVVTRLYGTHIVNAFYITDQENLDTFADKNLNFRVYHSFVIKYRETKLFLVKSQ